MKRILLLAVFIISANTIYCQSMSDYTFSAFSSTYTPVAGSYITPDGGDSWGIGMEFDDSWYSGIPIGFNFVYGCTTYTTLLASHNAWVVLGETLPAFEVDTYDDDLSNTFSGGIGGFNLPRPILAPLWSDVITSGLIVRYATTGTAPNRVFTIEWDSVSFFSSFVAPYHGPVGLSVELKLYETTNVIDFAYKFISSVSPGTGFLAIGITGGAGAYPQFGTQPFWSLNNTSASPTPSMTTEYKTLTGLPATNQVYRWSPVCTGAPSCGVSATVDNGCSPYSSVVSVVGVPCGIPGFTFQWQSSPDSSTWTNISGATDTTYSTSVTVTTYYRCVVTCGTTGASAPTPGIGLFLGAPAGGITGPTVVCLGSTVALGDGTPGGTWSSSAMGTATIDPSSGVVLGVAVGTATITYTLGSVVCYSTRVITVVSTPAPISGTLKVCTGGTTTLSETLPGGTWSSSATGTATIGATTGIAGGVSPGTTTITYAVGSCSTTSILTVNVSPAAIGGPGAVCLGSTIPLTDGTPGGTWATGRAATATVGPTGILTGVGSGPVVVIYTAPGGCTATRTITVNPLPSAVFAPSAGVCLGSSVPLFDPGGGTWASSNPSVATIGSSTGVFTGLAVGSTTITYTLPTGCITTTTVPVDPLPGAITGTTTACVGSTATLSDATGGGTWISSTPSVATIDPVVGVYSGVSAGTSTISYILIATSCIATTTVTVVAVPPAIVGPISVCVGATATLTDIPGGTWTSGAPSLATIGSTSGVVSGIAIGGVPITYTSPAGCRVTGGITVRSLPPAITGVMHVCVGQTTTLSDASAPGTLAWMSSNTTIATVGSSSGVVTGVSPGVDTVIYTAGTGCTALAFVTVNAAPGAISGAPMVCLGSTMTLTEPSSTGGTWTSSIPSIASVNPSTGVVSGLGLGLTTITYSAGGTCVATLVVTVNPLPSLFTITGGGGYCAGGVGVHIGASGSTPGISYQLFSGAIPVGPPITGTGAPLDFGLFTTAGIYTVIATNTVTGCSRTMTGSVTITINPSPDIFDVTGGGVFCLTGSGVHVGLDGSQTGIRYQLLLGGSPLGSPVTGTGGALDFGSETTVGTYTVSATNPATGCTATMSGSAIVATNPLPGLFTVSAVGGGSYCAGGSGVHIVLGGSATGVSYQLFNGLSAVGSPVTGTGSAIDFGLQTIAGTYTVVATIITTGCTRTMTGSGTITISPVPVISGGTAVCVGTNITLTATPSGGTWSSSNPANATIGTGTGVVTGLITGTSTTITYTSLTGCTTTASVNVSPSPGPITGSSLLCVGASVTDNDVVPGGVWTSSNTARASVGSSSGVVTGISAGAATITYSLGSGCTVTMGMTVTPAPSAISGPAVICSGATITLTDLPVGGTWSSSPASAGIATVNTATGVVLGEAAGMADITYTVGSCTAETTLTVNSAPAAISGPGTVCAGATVTLTDGIGGGTWTSSNSTAAPIGASTGTINGADPGGTSIITYSLGGACVVTKTITVNPIYPVTGATGICVSATTTLSDAAPGGTWSSGSTTIATVTPATGVVFALFSGTSVITYTTAAGCTAATTMTVNLAPSAISGNLHVCAGATTVLSDLAGGGTWVSSNLSVATVVFGTGEVTGVTPGTSIITYSLGSGCTVSATVTVNALPPAITGTPVLCAGSTTALSDPAGGGTWGNGGSSIATVSGTGVVTGTAGGTATITYTPGTGCAAIKIITVNPLPSAITGATNVCAGLTTILSDTDPGGTWSDPGSTGIATIDPAGTVTAVSAGTAAVTYTLPTGCKTTASVVVNSAPGAIFGTMNMCVGSTVTLSDPTSGGTWSDPGSAGIATIDAGTGAVTGESTGVATISYTVGGCPAVATVTVSALPDAIAGAGNICVGSAATLTDGSAGGTWSSPGGGGIVIIDATTGLLTGEGMGTAAITYSLGAGCNVSAIMTVDPLPAPIAGPLNVCNGYTAAFSDVSAGGAWSSSDPTIATITTTGVVLGVDGGTATISYTVGTGCVTTASILVIAVPPITGPADHLCAFGDTMSVFDAMPGGTWSSTLAPVSISGVVTGYGSGLATVTYTISTGCFATTILTINPVPAPITGNTNFCIGTSTTLVDTSADGIWSPASGAVASVSATGMVTGVSTGTAVISYILPATGCMQTTTVTVDPHPSAITGNPNVCVGSETILADSVSGGAWISSNPSIAAAVAGSGTVTGVSAGAATISYYFSAGCIALEPVTVNPLPAVYTTTGGGNYCSGTGGVHIGLGGTDESIIYRLYHGATLEGTVTGTGSAGDFGLETVAGTYKVVASNIITSCVENIPDSVTVTITPSVTPAITITASPANVVCAGTPVTFTVTSVNGGTPAYQWTVNGAAVGGDSTSYSYVPSNSDLVGTAMTSSATCAIPPTVSDAVTMTVVTPVIPAVTINATPGTNVKPGESVTLTATVTGGSSPTYQWEINGNPVAGATTATFTNSYNTGDTVTCVVSGGGVCNPVGSNFVVINVSNVGVTTVGTSGGGDVSVLPNPNNGEFVIRGSLGTVSDEDVSLEITDMLGQVVYRNKIVAHNGKLDEHILLNNGLANGMYILNLRSVNGNNVFHIVIEK